MALTWKDRSPSIQTLSENIPFFAFEGYDYRVSIEGDEVFVEMKKNPLGISSLAGPIRISDETHALLRRRIQQTPLEHWGSVAPRNLPPTTVVIAPHCPLEELADAK